MLNFLSSVFNIYIYKKHTLEEVFWVLKTLKLV